MAAIIYEYNGAGETEEKNVKRKKKRCIRRVTPRRIASPRGLASGPELTIFRVSSGLARGKIRFYPSDSATGLAMMWCGISPLTPRPAIILSNTF